MDSIDLVGDEVLDFEGARENEIVEEAVDDGEMREEAVDVLD